MPRRMESTGLNGAVQSIFKAVPGQSCSDRLRWILVFTCRNSFGAAEVKPLAAQTSTATEEIEAIALLVYASRKMQSVTAIVVTAIQDIITKIVQMILTSSEVAAADKMPGRHWPAVGYCW